MHGSQVFIFYIRGFPGLSVRLPRGKSEVLYQAEICVYQINILFFRLHITDCPLSAHTIKLTKVSKAVQYLLLVNIEVMLLIFIYAPNCVIMNILINGIQIKEQICFIFNTERRTCQFDIYGKTLTMWYIKLQRWY